MIPRKMKVATMAMLATAGMAVGLAGPAAAHPPSPTVSLGAPGTVATPGSGGSFQMFGTVQCYAGALAQPVQHLSITGTLNGGIGTPPTATTVTDDVGVFRLTGNLAWAGTITGGGNVTMPLPDGTTYSIALAQFEALRVGGLFGTSAGPFRIQLSNTYCDTLPDAY